ncbi:hypothetical protein [Cellulomonas sp. URHB0016]
MTWVGTTAARARHRRHVRTALMSAGAVLGLAVGTACTDHSDPTPTPSARTVTPTPTADPVVLPTGDATRPYGACGSWSAVHRHRHRPRVRRSSSSPPCRAASRLSREGRSASTGHSPTPAGAELALSGTELALVGCDDRQPLAPEVYTLYPRVALSGLRLTGDDLFRHGAVYGRPFDVIVTGD